MTEEGFKAFKQTDAYKQALEAAGGDETSKAMKQFIMDATRDEALNQELQYQLDTVKEMHLFKKAIIEVSIIP